MTRSDCAICSIDPSEIVLEKRFAAAAEATEKVTPGHMIVFPWRHVASWFDLTTEEIVEINMILRELKDICDGSHQPDGYNIGIDCGISAGQRSRHAVVNLIPRYSQTGGRETGGIREILKPGDDNLC